MCPIRSSTEASVCSSSHLCSYSAAHMRTYSFGFLFTFGYRKCVTHFKKTCFSSKSNWHCLSHSCDPLKEQPPTKTATQSSSPDIQKLFSSTIACIYHISSQIRKQPADSSAQQRFTAILHGGCSSATVLGSSTPGGSIR